MLKKAGMLKKNKSWHNTHASSCLLLIMKHQMNVRFITWSFNRLSSVSQNSLSHCGDLPEHDHALPLNLR